MSYPEVADVSHATPGMEALMRSYFTAKSAKDVGATMDHFSPDLRLYADATLGWPLPGFDALQGVFEEYMPNWGEGLSYPTRIVGDEGSAVVFMTDTPELFGQELLAVAAVDVRDGKIVRWIDYWDSVHSGVAGADQLRTPDEQFPAEFGEEGLESVASEAIRRITSELTAALAQGDAAAATALFSADALLEDMVLRSQVRGQRAIGRYLERSIDSLPYGRDVQVRHVLGADIGGGFEWSSGGAARRLLRGITALDLEADQISRMTTVWDGSLIDRDALTALARQVIEPAA